ncbi:uncharacterized protein LOC134270281 [Saccostrea cucullata]|uniref:uncharacterized protein LOC134270281 n=1 Tax=Saccostrea cuccullata TaxID=36930 RepID=UPI002ED099D8
MEYTAKCKTFTVFTSFNKTNSFCFKGIDGKLNGDNLDIRVDTNDVRMNNKAKYYHFFATDWVADRVSEKLKDLDDRSPVGNINQISYVNFIPTPEENTQFKNYLKVLLARKIVDYMPEFKWMEKVLPDHIPHDLQQEMSTPSKIFMLPKNDACYSDCLHILDSYVEDINRIYAKAGRGGELDKLQVPVGGDQLTRVRLEGAKALRKGTHTAVERFDQLNPFIIELFHTLQDFLEKLCKKFLKLNKATDKATLAHLKVVIRRSNVNGKVKVRFKAHEQFVDCVGTAYLLSLVMELFRMQNLHDFPIHDSIPDNVKMLHLGRRSETFNKVMDLVLKKTFIPPLQQDTEDNGQPRPGSLIVQVCAGNMNPCQIESPVNENQVTIKLSIGEEMYHLKASTEQVRNGCTFHLTNKQIPVTVKEVTPPSDELQNYTINFLNWFFISCSMQDAISEGNIYLTNITLKYMMPLFYSHSSLSKYMTECIDYVLKTETLLTPKMALKVRAASFINPTGRLGHNKAADIEKENQVKMLKDLIRGLGANKTENAIVKISKVAPVIHSISDNLCAMTSTQNFHTTHKVRPCDQDVQQILDILQKNNPWQNTPGRHLKAFKYISKSPYSFNRQHFEMCVMNTVERLKRGIPTTDDRESDDDE